jgi:hypothetical protein
MPLQFTYNGEYWQNPCVSIVPGAAPGAPQVISVGPLVNTGPAAAVASVQLWYIPVGQVINAANAVAILLAPSFYVLDTNTLVQQNIAPGASAIWTCSPQAPIPAGQLHLFAQGNAPPTPPTWSGFTPTNALNDVFVT